MSEGSVLIGSDHLGLALKGALKSLLGIWNWIDVGPFDSQKVDYPDYAARLAIKLLEGQAARGVLICGTGIGMSIVANRFSGVRAAVGNDLLAARLSRENNDANVLCLGSRFITPSQAAEIATIWLETPFEGSERARTRLAKIVVIEADASRRARMETRDDR